MTSPLHNGKLHVRSRVTLTLVLGVIKSLLIDDGVNSNGSFPDRSEGEQIGTFLFHKRSTATAHFQKFTLANKRDSPFRPPLSSSSSHVQPSLPPSPCLNPYPVCLSPMMSSRWPLPMGTRLSTALIPVCMGSFTEMRGMIPGAFTPTRARRSVAIGPWDETDKDCIPMGRWVWGLKLPALVYKMRLA